MLEYLVAWKTMSWCVGKEFDDIRREVDREIDRLEGALADFSSTAREPSLETV